MTKDVQSAGIITFIRQNNTIHFLLLKYKTGHWDFPKGKLEPEETLEQAAHRELFEETNLHATLFPGFLESLSYHFTDFDGKRAHKTVSYFIGETDSTAVHLSDEHTSHQWLPFEQAIRKLTFENAKQILARAYEFLQR